MDNHFVSVADANSLEELLSRSHSEPVIIFKHSTTCPISAAAYTQMSKLDREIALVVVQRARDVSREVEARTGIEHESPQTIILRNGKAVWSASHWSIKTDVVAEALQQNR
ncbi:MAG TPA: bacillithiol system redox-active protein YtxJ [Pyrinomonadaceae bacterium]|jgi:bacillithiol system protein YtxJ